MGRLLRRNRLERQLDVELRDHFDRLVADYVADGSSEAEARRRARLDFGGLDQIKELCRDERGTRWLDDIVQDVRYGYRGLLRNRGFIAVAVLTLALGVGANAAVFSVVNALMLRRLPVPNANDLITLERRQGNVTGGAFSYPQIQQLAAQTDLFNGLCAFATDTVNVGPPDALEEISAQFVSGAYYDVLGLAPPAGRLLSAADDDTGASPAAVISDGYWHRRFGGSSDAIGQSILVEGVPVPIVGVTPSGFTGTTIGESPDVTLAIRVRPIVRPDQAFYLGPGARWLRVLARPRANLSLPQLAAQARERWTQLLEAAASPKRTPDEQRRLQAETLGVVSGRTGTSLLRRNFQSSLQVALGFVFLVLLIACVNVANLLLARGTTRQREIAVRLSIGAGRWRIVRQLLTECALIAIAGAIAGSAIAWAGSRGLVSLIAQREGGPDASKVVLDLTPDWMMLGATLVMVTLTVLVAGSAPAWRASRVQPGAALGASTRIAESLGRIGSSLVVVQVAMSLVLVIGAGLFARTLYNLRTLDRGFAVDDVLVVEVPAGRAGYTGPRLQALQRELLDFMRQLRGVRAAAVTSITPLAGGGISQGITVNGVPIAETELHFNNVGPGYFGVLHTPIVVGRDFADSDGPAGPFVAIVNEAFVAQYLTGVNPLGQRVNVIGSTRADMEIVGVVKDAVYETLRQTPPPTVYAAHQQRISSASFVVHAPGAVAAVAASIHAEVQPRLGGRRPRIHTLNDQLERSLVLERLLARVALIFGSLALTLAAVGLYGLAAYWVASRTREIGVRVALGARSAQILSLVLGDTMRMVAAGVGVGVLAAWGLGRLVSGMIFGLTATDTVTMIAGVGVLLATGALAGLAPASRATRIDPQTALRNE
jgi:predicted permease